MKKAIDWRSVRLLGIASLITLVPAVLAVSWALGPIVTSIRQAGEDSELVRHLRKMAAEKPAYHSALVRAQKIIANQAVLYHASSAELASAQLQSVLQGLVLQSGGRLSSSAIDAPQGSHGLQTLTVSLAFSLPPAHLAALLSALDTQKPFLVVQTLDVRAVSNGLGQGQLNVQMRVNAFGAKL